MVKRFHLWNFKSFLYQFLADIPPGSGIHAVLLLSENHQKGHQNQDEQPVEIHSVFLANCWRQAMELLRQLDLWGRKDRSKPEVSRIDIYIAIVQKRASFGAKEYRWIP